MNLKKAKQLYKFAHKHFKSQSQIDQAHQAEKKLAPRLKVSFSNESLSLTKSDYVEWKMICKKLK